jgi:hypothetical protein
MDRFPLTQMPSSSLSKSSVGNVPSPASVSPEGATTTRRIALDWNWAVQRAAFH